MKPIGNRISHPLALLVLIATGIATTIGSGGNGFDGGGGGEEPQGPTLAITADNGPDVASAAILAFGLGFDLTDIVGAPIFPEPDGVAPLALKSLAPVGSVELSATSLYLVPVGCDGGGTRDITSVVADPTTVTIGDRVTATFVECDDNQGFVIDGVIDILVQDVQGDVLTDVFLLALDTTLTELSITEGTYTFSADGDFMLTLGSIDFPVVRLSLTGTRLELGMPGEVFTLTNFDHWLSVDGGVFPDTKTGSVTGRLGSQVLGGTVDYETVELVQGTGDLDPEAGEILVTGAGGSTVRIVIIDSTSVRLDIDTNGDGVVDSSVDTSWAELNGDTSTINSSTAPVIAREAYQSAVGFGSVTLAIGSQFQASSTFGLLAQQAVEGDFGPVEISCGIAGNVSVSGYVDVAGTYTTGDQLNAAFDGCTRTDGVLNGQMDVLVSDYQGDSAGPFLFSGSAVETVLERTALGFVFTGSGTIDTVYDRVFTTPGVVYIDGSATAFTVSSDGNDRQLSAAEVHSQLYVGPAPVTIVRSSSGAMTSPAFDGTLTYESIVPDTFLADSDPATGPISGELLVTASDGSTVRIVALDEVNVRLEIDADGDAIIDAQISMAWADLQ